MLARYLNILLIDWQVYKPNFVIQWSSLYDFIAE